MIEEQRQRVEQELTKMIDEMDRSCLRKMQLQMHNCAIVCCNDMTSSMPTVQRCVERCSEPLSNAQNFVQSEIEQFQGRLQRCVMQCNDDIKISLGANPSEAEIAKSTLKFERCAVSCVDKNVSLIPQLLKTIKTVLSKERNSMHDV